MKWLQCDIFLSECRRFESGLCRHAVPWPRNFAFQCLSPPRCINVHSQTIEGMYRIRS